MYAHLQEEQLGSLKDDLVTCIEGEEGHGGKLSGICKEVGIFLFIKKKCVVVIFSFSFVIPCAPNYGKTISMMISLTNYHILGDDQDLDDRIIRQLWEENKELREEVSQLRKSSGDDADEGRKPKIIFK